MLFRSSTQNDFSSTTLIRLNLIEYVELFIFLLVAMIYINAIREYNFFSWINNLLVNLGFNTKKLFWMTGLISFFISPIADNLTTAMIMSSIIISISKKDRSFANISCVNIVIAANSGGAFSPFGDITTLMVWQKGVIPFTGFFSIFVPSVVNYIVPAVIMYFAIPKESPKQSDEKVGLKKGALVSILLFLANCWSSC